MAAPLLNRTRVLAAKHEGTPGTAEALTASEGVFRVYNMRIGPEIEFEGRESQGSLSQEPGVLGSYIGRCEFDIDLFGGASAAWASTFLPACGFANSTGVYSPDQRTPDTGSSGTKSLTIGAYKNGRRELLHGAMGNVQFILRPGFVCRAHFTFRGIWNTVADVAILAPTYPTTAPLRSASATFTVGSVTPLGGEITIDAGNEIVLRETHTTASGIYMAVITNKRPTMRFAPEANLVANYDPYGDWIARTERALSYIVGSGGNRITFAAPKLQVTSIEEGERSGLLTDIIAYQLNKSAAAGQDELVITLD